MVVGRPCNDCGTGTVGCTGKCSNCDSEDRMPQMCGTKMNRPILVDMSQAIRRAKWDLWFLGLAKYTSTASKDPSTKTGAVIVDTDNRVVSLGYNGFPKGVADTDERLNNRDLKYKMIVHCERNAMLFAQRSLANCTLYTWPFMSCSVCAAMVVQSGIKRVVAPESPPDKLARWGDDFILAKTLFSEANVELELYPLDPV